MKIIKQYGSDERKLLIAMIVDKDFLSKITDKWNQEGLFKSKWSNLIGKWCIRHYNKYEEAPNKQIENIFANWTKGHKDEDTIKLIDKFLSVLSDEYEGHQEEINTKYTLDVAKRYFNDVKLHNLVDRLQDSLDSHNSKQAIADVLSYEQVEVGLGIGLDILNEQKAIQDALNECYEPMIVYPGRIGKMMEKCMYREGFVSFMGPDKSGKSFYLLDAAYRAIVQRKKVAYFEAGDNSQEEVIQRLMCRVTHRPLKACKIKYPVELSKEEDSNFSYVEHKTKKYKNKMNWQEAWKKCEEIKKRKIKSKNSFLKLSAHPNSTISVRDIESILQSWEGDGWVPDVIVIDYADILNMDTYGMKDTRDKINETWKALRSLSQKYHALVITATQANSGGYKKEETAKLLSKDNFSDSKGKLAHVTAMIGINQSKDNEKDEGLQRLNFIALRSGRFSDKYCVHVAGCLAIANPIIKSCV